MSDRKKVLIIDDMEKNLADISMILREKYLMGFAKSGRDALEQLKYELPDLILLDTVMPDFDGFATIMRLKSNPATVNIPVIMLTEGFNIEAQRQGFRLGAADFITKPFVPDIMIKRMESVLELDMLKKRLTAEINRKTRQLEISTIQVISCVADIVDNQSPYTKGHSTRVAGCASDIARRMGFEESEVYNIYYVSLLHDVGKLIEPYDGCFGYEAELNEQERAVMYRHCTAGADLLREFTLFNGIMDGARYHHERYDGKNNVSGLSGEQIPLIARIITVANAYDNMKSFRSYRKPMTDAEVRAEFEKNNGSIFDPKVVDVMVAMIDEGYTVKNILSSDGADVTRFGNVILHKAISEYAEEIDINSQKDSLTGLWDKKYAESAINEYLARENRNGVMYLLDMDNFKLINDSYGHIQGDEVLIKFADIMRENKQEDDLLCRIGGDEFIIFSKGKPVELRSKERAEMIITNFGKLMPGLDISLSIGIATAPNDGCTFAELYGNADKALYYVKQNGKNGAHFYSNVDSSEDSTVSRENTLADLQFIKNMFEDKDETKGALKVEYGNFKNIYHFIERCIARTQQNVDLVLFTIQDESGSMPDVMDLKKAGEIFNKSACENVRRGDVFTPFSSSQYVVILMDVKENYGSKVAERIKAMFNAAKGDLPVELKYDIQQIEAK